MSITSVNQVSSGVTSRNQTEQDSHEKNIQKQIANLQEKVKSITYDREKTKEEKASEKKALQEQIQSLNSELKQYQAQKRQEEAAKRQEKLRAQEAAQVQKTDLTQKRAPEGGAGTQKAREQQAPESRKDEQTDTANTGFRDGEAGVIISISNGKEQISCMKKIRTGLEGRLRTAETEQEKFELQERINHVSQSMGEKVKKIADAIADNQKTEQERKDKVGEILREQEKAREERKEAMNVVISNSTHKSVETERRKENFVVSGKVSIT